VVLNRFTAFFNGEYPNRAKTAGTNGKTGRLQFFSRHGHTEVFVAHVCVGFPQQP
jgi:hypothetical protein